LTVAKRSRSPDSTRPSFPRPRRREAVPWGPVDRVLACLEPIRDFLRSHPVLVLAFVLVLLLVARPIAAFGVLLDQHPGFVG